MTRIVFCDVEGTLLRDSFPRLVLHEARAMGVLTGWQQIQTGALVRISTFLPGGAGRALQMLGMVRSIAGSHAPELETVLSNALPKVLDACKPEMLARLQDHRRDGYQLVLISAGLHEGIVRLAEALGGRGEGTRLRRRAGRYTARIDGQLCQGSGKAARALAVLRELDVDPQACLAYGDTESDIPYLTLFGHPIAVDPDSGLCRYAKRHGWPVLDTTHRISDTTRRSPVLATSQPRVAPAPAQNASNAQPSVDDLAQAALAQFVTPHRIPLRPREAEILQSGTPLVFGNGLVSTIWGDGPTILLVHGWEGRGTNLMAFIPPLVASGFRVVALDGPAHGDSPGETTDPMDFALHLIQVGQELGPLAGVIAHSMGAASTGLALQRGLRAEKVVLLAGAASLLAFLQRYAQATGMAEPVAERFYAMMALRVGVAPEAMDAAEVCRDFSVPALVFHDPDDLEVPFAEAEAVVAAWPGAELRLASGCGHRRILFAPLVVADTVAFLAGAPALA
ncbi:MAG: HAD-IB family phosphatase [Ktedonobacterales bacterium]